MEQVRFLLVDVGRLTKHRAGRILPVLFSDAFATLAWYRLNRAAWLIFGRGWSMARAVLSPLVALLRPWLRLEIDYRADIGPGLAILHPALGVVVNGDTKIGSYATLVGGICIGGRGVVIGDDLTVGANAPIIGPVELGDGVTIGAGAAVVSSFAGPVTLVGVPARPAGAGEERAGTAF